MFSVRNLNIKNKLMAIIMIASSSAVFFAGSIFISFSTYSHRADLARELTSLATVIGNNCKVILEFKVYEDAQKVLSTLKGRRSIILARLYDSTGETISTYSHEVLGEILDLPETPENSHLFAHGILHVFHYVRLNERVIGVIYLQDDMRQVYAGLKHDVFILILIVLIASAAAYIVSSKLQKMISGPILSLAGIAGTVSEKKDYSIRADKNSEDEVGRLIDSFNDMLSIIQHSDEALRESKELLSESQKYANIGSWMWDLKTGIVVWSEHLFTILGRDIGLGPPAMDAYLDSYHPDDKRLLQEAIEATIKKDEPFNVEYRIFRENDGEQRWIFSKGKLEKGENGEPGRVMGIALDITERKQAEADKARLEEQLRQAQKMESIGTLAGGIAHDFNNILGIIVGNTELAMTAVPEWNPASCNLEEVLKASLRARDMVRQILSFSRQAQLEMKPVRIGPLLEESLMFIRSSIPTTIEIRKNISNQPDTILADSTQINQVLMNLYTNANQAMRKNGGVLEVSLKNIVLEEQDAARYHDLTPGNYLSLRVSDTGPGIEPEILERIFEPYFTTKEIGEGTGMGLSVVHGIVKNHKGEIQVYSEPGKGTTFHVLFPLIKGETGRFTTHPGPLPTGYERVLFVDDEEALADMGKQMLQHLGYDVTMKTNSIDALEAFKARPDNFDLVVTDMTMPNMTGVDLSREILKLRADIPIILCTGFSEMVSEEKARQLGLKELVMKPLAMRETAFTIRRALGREEIKEELPGGTILLVEDDDQMRAAIRQMLEGAGHQVEEAPNGKIAAKLYRARPADLIITDLVMPEKEGIELILELRRDIPEVKIIAISGGGQLGPEEYLPLAQDLGAAYTFEKPFKQEDLLAAVQDILTAKL